MPDILLFGATGYTGRLTAAALGARGASFALAGRNPSKLEALASEVGAEDARVAEAGNPETLVRALDDCKVLITCVGPFVDHGAAAVEACLATGTHYIDSCGEGTFVAALLDRDAEARGAGITMAPAMGFDEAPCDLGVALAVDGLHRPDVVVTYAVPTTPSGGTLRSALGTLLSPGARIVDGAPEDLHLADQRRVSPMPPPLGPKPAMSAPLAIGHLAPRHADVASFGTFVTTNPLLRTMARATRVPLSGFVKSAAGKKLVGAALAHVPEGPDDRARRKRWTILIEARSGPRWRNVTLQGEDFYGLTAELLSAGALAMSGEGHDRVGVLSPVQAFGTTLLEEELRRFGVSITAFDDT